MLPDSIILQSAGSLSVAILALLITILQAGLFLKNRRLPWYAWSAAISFSAFLYALGIFIEYNTPQGPLNRFSGLLEYTAIVFLVHCAYGFTFSYLMMEAKWYHPIAGACHAIVLIVLWSTDYIVADRFEARDFVGLTAPFVEPSLGPAGPVFVLYACLAGITVMILWIKETETIQKHRIAYLVGMGLWLLLGVHDGLASLGVPAFQYVMEYGFLGFAIVVLWVVFSSHLELTAVEKYRAITELANDCILVVQDGKMVFANPACGELTGCTSAELGTGVLLGAMHPEDRKTVLDHYKTLQAGERSTNPYTVRIQRSGGEQRFVEIVSSMIRYMNKPAVLGIMRDTTERRRVEEEREKLIGELQEALATVKTLSGLLPICASCKKIRDDKGYWNRIEAYIKEHTEADFTHSICPECARKQYPDLDLFEEEGTGEEK